MKYSISYSAEAIKTYVIEADNMHEARRKAYALMDSDFLEQILGDLIWNMTSGNRSTVDLWKVSAEHDDEPVTVSAGQIARAIGE